MSTLIRRVGDPNVGHTDAFLALTKDEEDNILAALLAKRSGAARVMALVNKLPYAALVTTIGVDSVVSPNVSAVSAIASVSVPIAPVTVSVSTIAVAVTVSVGPVTE